MSVYHPDRFIVLEITPDEGDPFHKVFGSWFGGYLNGDSWRMNSGISKIEKDEDGNIHFHGDSGSVYICRPGTYGATSYTGQIVAELLKKGNVKVVDQTTTDWLNVLGVT